MPSNSTATNLRAVPESKRPRPALKLRPQRSQAAHRRQSEVVEQVRAAFKPDARLATLLGCLAGALPPLSAYVLAHLPTPVAWYLWVIVAGALLFSAKTVFQWAALAFADKVKAFGFVVLLEGVMTLSPVIWLSYLALAYLIAINAIATGCTLSRRADK